MNSDKIQNDTEKLFRILGKKIRIDILKKLSSRESLLPYSVLQKEVFALNQNSVNFTYHLKALENIGFISSSKEGYFITSIGKKMLKMIISMEEYIDHHNNVKLIRTSKYSKEIFNFKKIEEYLIVEGKLEKFQAKEIAMKAKRRLSKTNIKYLTTPLMREFINVILLENGLEEARHRLTRLGTPPMEVYKLFDSVESHKITPKEFIKKLGSDVSEQFLLLNLLPNDLADLYLSGEVVLLNLNYWALRPLSIYVNANTILDYISKKYKIKHNTSLNSRDLIKFLLSLLDLLYEFKMYISEDIVLGNFNYLISSILENQRKEKETYFFDILTTIILKYNSYFEDHKRHLCLDFSYKEKGLKSSGNASHLQNDKKFIKKLKSNLYPGNDYKNPLIMFDYSELKPLNLLNLITNNDNLSDFLNDIVFYNGVSSNLLNSTIVKVPKFDKSETNNNKIILDKILINLHSIAINANQNDDIFFDLLQNKLNSVFQLFNYKEQLVHRKLNSLKGWDNIITILTEKSNVDWRNYCIKSISFFGLNEAVRTQCGIELDRIATSESFALRILSFINHLIKERNKSESESFVFTQPHPNVYLNNSWTKSMIGLNKSKCYSSRIIRKNSKLSLNKQISLFKKFEEFFEGGSLFATSMPIESLGDKLRTLMNSRLNAFSIDELISQ